MRKKVCAILCLLAIAVAAAAVNDRKQHTISRVAAFYLVQNRLPEDTPCRFDVVAIDGEEITLYKNAFDYCG